MAMNGEKKRTKSKESDYLQDAEARKHSRHPHPDLLLTDRECIEKYGRVMFPGRHRKEFETVEECKYRWHIYLQDSYPASGFGTKPFEVSTTHGYTKAYAEYTNEIERAREQWITDHPGSVVDGRAIISQKNDS